MGVYVMIIVFENGAVDLCKVIAKDTWMNIIPLSDNAVIVDDFKVACSSTSELIEEMQSNDTVSSLCSKHSYIDYIVIKQWHTVDELIAI